MVADGFEYVDAENVVSGLRLMALPDGVVPIEAIVIIKAMDADGHSSWRSRYSEGLSHIETVGAMRVMTQLAEREAVAAYVPTEDD